MVMRKITHCLSGVVVLAVLFFAIPTREVLARPCTETTIHVVAWGETLSSIAANYGVTIGDIVTANHLVEADRIFVGQSLVISGVSGSVSLGDGYSGLHVVQSGETLYRISLKYNVAIQTLVTINNLPDAEHVYAGQTLIVPRFDSDTDTAISSESATSTGNVHIVQPSETLFGISQRYGVSVSDLQTTNNLLNPSWIFAGQSLVIPGAANVPGPGYTPAQAVVTHVIQPGENLSTIAAYYGMSMWVIAQSNNVSNVSLIYPGQVLSIPSVNALSPSVTPSMSVSVGKSIVVDVSEQRAYIDEDGIVQHVFVVSTGLPGHDTRRGSFQIQNKIPMAYAATWDLQMPYWLGFYWAGSLQNGFHALPILSNGASLWETLLGSPASYGCVILSENDARWLYEWANIGTSVVVQD